MAAQLHNFRHPGNLGLSLPGRAPILARRCGNGWTTLFSAIDRGCSRCRRLSMV